MPKLPPPHSSGYGPRISAYQSPFFAVPAYYNLFPQQPPTCPGWYFTWTGSQANYLYWPGDWSEVGYWVELPRFVQGMLGKP